VLTVCITTVAPPTRAVRAWAHRAPEPIACLVVAGDRKGPAAFNVSHTVFLSLREQVAGPFDLARKIPEGHYCRKNIAYLEAMRAGATCVYETDDDNAPLPGWTPRKETPEGVCAACAGASPLSRWVNVYRYFTADPSIWPRGLPLDQVSRTVPELTAAAPQLSAPIQQGLVNGSPDVDAVWRLTQDRPFDFDGGPSVRLGPGQWCPFNTQSTWWWPAAYPLMYIPAHCSFRMCDIWRSFVAQRCLWALGLGVVFHAAEVLQARNTHDLMRDFEDEIPGYLLNAKIVRALDELDLSPQEEGVPANLVACYRRLVEHKVFPASELELLQVWLSDLASTGVGGGSGGLPHARRTVAPGHDAGDAR
jgi:hypothetical protein